MFFWVVLGGGARGLLGEVVDRCGTRTEAQPPWLKRRGSSLFKKSYVRVGLGQGCAVVKLG